MSPDLLVTVAVAVLGSSSLVALINWLKDRKTDAAQVENLSSQSLREALVAVRTELHEVRAELRETKLALDKALKELERYRRVLVSLDKDHLIEGDE